jgi:hypothetical protein
LSATRDAGDDAVLVVVNSTRTRHEGVCVLPSALGLGAPVRSPTRSAGARTPGARATTSASAGQAHVFEVQRRDAARQLRAKRRLQDLPAEYGGGIDAPQALRLLPIRLAGQ